MGSELKEIKVPEWWSNGVMSYRRDALPFEHPECTYNYIQRVYGVKPEDYGVFGPSCPLCGRK